MFGCQAILFGPAPCDGQSQSGSLPRPCAAGPDGTSLNSTAVLLWRSRRAHIVSSFHPLWSERPEGARLEEGEEEGEYMLAPEYPGPQAEL